jgi:Ras-related GTP-binding protein A/B
MENFLQNQRVDVFSGVALLIYVFDIESRDFPRDLETFKTVLEALYNGSRDARLFCLFHKMDLVQENLRESLFFERETILRQISYMFADIVVLGTSIWDETLYKVCYLVQCCANKGVVVDRAVPDTEYRCNRSSS